ncbi:DUF948 domain-containing protein [Paenibacillus sp. WQ 127069]|uniref:DUF948 domain-containing protein n=1 Tax=Paenibacillus baimaensis TaxID=2982185 RepID=A0ABT2UJ37_9BACL|nr:DUF948 domain-containing protein [Paenibacillus sp. WQ 127069]MCU6794654.1 DUF948 domain-containing protein [Paenibacillus sp. WQ 127069]
MDWPLIVSLAVLTGVMVIGIALLLWIEVRRAIRRSLAMMERMEAQMKGTLEDTQQLIQTTQSLTVDIQRRLHAADGIMQAIQSTGEASASLSKSIKGISGVLSNSITEARATLQNEQDTVRNLIAMTTMGVELWHKWQSRKPSKPSSPANEQQ